MSEEKYCPICGGPMTTGGLIHQHWCPHAEHNKVKLPESQGRPMQGWVCPKCGRVYAPWVPACSLCGPKKEARGTSYWNKSGNE